MDPTETIDIKEEILCDIKKEPIFIQETEELMNDIKEEPKETDDNIINEEKQDEQDDDDHSSEDELLLPDSPHDGIVQLETLSPVLIEKYEKYYEQFEKWKSEDGYGSIITEDVITHYFKEMIERNRPATSSTHASRLAILRIVINHKHAIDIFEFAKVKELSVQLKNNMFTKKTATFTVEELETFLKTAPDDQYLLVKVVLIIGLTGLVKRPSDFTKITINDFVINGRSLKIKPTQLKAQNLVKRVVFAESNSIIRKYINLRPVHTDTKNFFLRYENGVCSEQAIGKLGFEIMPRLIAEFLKLKHPEDYIGTTFYDTAKILSARSSKPLKIKSKTQKTKQKYESAFEQFDKWRIDRGHETLTEDCIMNWVDEMGKQEPVISAGTIATKITMIRQYINSYKDFDIFDFERVRNVHEELRMKYKRKFVPKEIKTFKLREIEQFLRKAPDLQYLLMKAVLIVGITGICTTGQEFGDIMIDDFKDNGTSMTYEVNKKFNKKIGNVPRIISGESYNILRKYMNMRPVHTEVYNLFLHYANGVCTKNPVNRLRFSGMPKAIAEYLKLPNPEDYGGSTFHDTAQFLLKKTTGTSGMAGKGQICEPTPPKIDRRKVRDRQSPSPSVDICNEAAYDEPSSSEPMKFHQPSCKKIHHFDLDISPSPSTYNCPGKPTLEVSTDDNNTIYVHLQNCPHMKVYFIRN